MMFEIGTDIEEVERFKKYNNKEHSFLKAVYTDEELEYCFKNKQYAQHLAGKFCAKESCIKALKIDNLKLNQIIILNNEDGSPYVKFNDIDINYQISLSISHTRNYATATVIARKET